MTLGVKKGLAWVAMASTIIYLVITITEDKLVWWTLIPAFFVFMSIFSDLVSLYIIKRNKAVGTKMDTISLVFGVCFVLSLIIISILIK